MLQCICIWYDSSWRAQDISKLLTYWLPLIDMLSSICLSHIRHQPTICLVAPLLVGILNSLDVKVAVIPLGSSTGASILLSHSNHFALNSKVRTTVQDNSQIASIVSLCYLIKRGLHQKFLQSAIILIHPHAAFLLSSDASHEFLPSLIESLAWHTSGSLNASAY